MNRKIFLKNSIIGSIFSLFTLKTINASTTLNKNIHLRYLINGSIFELYFPKNALDTLKNDDVGKGFAGTTIPFFIPKDMEKYSLSQQYIDNKI